MTVLKSSRSMNRTATSPPLGERLRRTRSMNSVRLARLGERVVVGLVVELLLERAAACMTACSSRSYCSATLALVASVSSRRRSSSPKARTRPKRLASMIVPITRSSPGSMREHRVADAAALQVAPQARGPNGGVSADDGVLVRRPARAARRRPRRRSAPSARGTSPGPRAVRSDGSPSAPNRMISASSARNASSERASRPSSASATSRRARERAVGLVEELQALVALALGDVRAVGDEQGRAGDHQQRQRLARWLPRAPRRTVPGSSCSLSRAGP